MFQLIRLTASCVFEDNIAAGTSTGGLKINVPGRFGDSGIIGAGTYCSKFRGVPVQDMVKRF
jgi:isoaspartyl peptidase/L-asparaginase-like protein (Ntn-hydrolase superfamily)